MTRAVAAAVSAAMFENAGDTPATTEYAFLPVAVKLETASRWKARTERQVLTTALIQVFAPEVRTFRLLGSWRLLIGAKYRAA